VPPQLQVVHFRPYSTAPHHQKIVELTRKSIDTYKHTCERAAGFVHAFCLSGKLTAAR
jgi:hypothetical protein